MTGGIPDLWRTEVARLDAASATPAAYPYWHQHKFTDRNPRPV